MRKNYFVKSLLAVVLGILLLQTVVMADVDSLNISQIIQNGNDVYVYVNALDSAGNVSADAVTAEQFSVSIDKGQAMPVQDASSFQSLNQGISYIFCIDVSGSVTAQEMEEIRSSITEFVNGMSANDYARIMTIGSEITSICDSTQDKNALLTAIQGINNDAKFTYLYKGLSFALNGQRKSVDTMPKRAAIVLFTDGMDDSDGASGESQVLLDIAETRIPIYVVGLKGKDPDANLNSVGQIARQSGGSVFSYSDMSITQSLQSIGNLMRSTYQLHVVPEEERFGSKNLEWGVSFSSGGYSVSSPSYVYSLGMENVVLATPTPKATATPKPTSVPEPTPTPVPEKSTMDQIMEFVQDNLIICIAAGFVLIALLIIVVCLILKSRKDKNGSEKDSSDKGLLPPDDRGTIVDEWDRDDETKTEISDENEWTVDALDPYDNEATIDGSQERGLRMEFEITFDGRTEIAEHILRDELVLGRGSECDVDVVLHSLSESRKQTSRRHAIIVERPEGLYVRDNSKNKTYINGQEVVGEMALRNEDVLQLGKSTVKVRILSY